MVNMLLTQNLQIPVAIFAAGDLTLKLSRDISKIREKQKIRRSILTLNWTISNITNVIKEKKSINITKVSSGNDIS